LNPPFVMAKKFKVRIQTASGGRYRNNFSGPVKGGALVPGLFY